MNDAEVKLQVKIDSKDGTKEIEKLEKKSNNLDTLLKNKKIDINTDLSKLKLSDLSSRVKILKSELANQKQNSINLTTEQAQQNVKKLEDQIKKTEQEIKSRTEKISSSFTKVGKTMTVGLTLPILGLVTAGISYNAQMETFTANLTTLLGSSDKASAMLADIKEMASTTPFETTDLLSATQKMLAFGIASDKTNGYLKVLGDISMGDANKLDSLTLAFSQISASGKATMEDINQMVDAGFNPLLYISKQTGKTIGELREEVSAGSISFDDIAQAMQYATSKGQPFFNAMETASQTTTGKISTLKDGFNTAVGTLTESLLPTFSKVVSKLTELTEWFASLSEKQKGMILTVLGVLAVLGPLLMIIGAIVPAISAIGTVIGFLLSPIGLIVLAIGAVIGVIIYLTATSEEFRNAMINIFNFVWAYILPIINNIALLFSGLISIIKGFVLIISGLLTGDMKSIVNGFENIFKGIGNVVISVLNSVLTTMNRFISFALIPLNALISGINNIPGVSIPKLKFAIPNIPALKIGTDMVFDDGLAYLHKGEQVVNAANVASGGYSGGGNQTIYVEIPTIELDGKTVGRGITPYVTKTIKSVGGNI